MSGLNGYVASWEELFTFQPDLKRARNVRKGKTYEYQQPPGARKRELADLEVLTSSTRRALSLSRPASRIDYAVSSANTRESTTPLSGEAAAQSGAPEGHSVLPRHVVPVEAVTTRNISTYAAGSLKYRSAVGDFVLRRPTQPTQEGPQVSSGRVAGRVRQMREAAARLPLGNKPAASSLPTKPKDVAERYVRKEGTVVPVASETEAATASVRPSDNSTLRTKSTEAVGSMGKPPVAPATVTALDASSSSGRSTSAAKLSGSTKDLVAASLSSRRELTPSDQDKPPPAIRCPPDRTTTGDVLRGDSTAASTSPDIPHHRYPESHARPDAARSVATLVEATAAWNRRRTRCTSTPATQDVEVPWSSRQREQEGDDDRSALSPAQWQGTTGRRPGLAHPTSTASLVLVTG